MNKRVLFIGMDPAHRGDPDKPLEGAIALRLSRLLCMDREMFIKSFDRMNLNQLPLTSFDHEEAQRKVAGILRSKRYGRLVLLGRVVTAEFKLPFTPLYERSREGKRCLIFPHPSGLNRWWNDQSNILQAGKALRRFIYETQVT